MLAPLVPLFEVLTALLGSVASVALALTPLNTVLEGLAIVIDFVVKGITKVWNWIVDKLADFVGFFSKSLERKIRRAALTPTGKSAEDIVSITDGAAEAAKAAQEAAANGVNDAMGDLADTTRTLNSELANVPAGFKIAQRRFEANRGDVAGIEGAAAGPSIGSINIEVADAADFYEKLKGLMSFDSYFNTGTIIQSVGPQSVDGRGA